MKVALPFNGGTKYVHTLYRTYGFLTKPHFIDHLREGWHWMIHQILKHSKDVDYCLAWDDNPYRDFDILRRHVPNIICPLHKIRDLDTYYDDFDWFGYPNRDHWRDYDVFEFLAQTEGKKRWWLGFPQSQPHVVFTCFDGADTSFPHWVAKSGRIWHSWGDTTPAPEHNYLTRLQYNVQHLAKELLK
jgi:hypothetical protein